MPRTSANIYDTFGNEVSFRVAQDTLIQYIQNSTVDFPLPEASAEILRELITRTENINSAELEQVKAKLEISGFQEANATAMATLIIKIARQQGVSPLTYFEANSDTLRFTRDAYDAINALRPAGNRVGLAIPKNNRNSRKRALIKP